jgi:hypothetical protein
MIGTVTKKVVDGAKVFWPTPSLTYTDVDIIVPAGTLTEGPYRVVTILTFKNQHGAPQELAAFVEGPIIQIYKPA